MARNWANMGVSWATETVKLDGKEYAGAEIIQIVDLEKFAAALKAEGGDVMEVLNASNSPRVASQDVKRRGLDTSGEALREKVWMRMIGTRAPRSVVATKVIVITLPNGDTYSGTSRTEYMAAYMAAAVDVGINAERARGIAEKVAATLDHLK